MAASRRRAAPVVFALALALASCTPEEAPRDEDAAPHEGAAPHDDAAPEETPEAARGADRPTTGPPDDDALDRVDEIVEEVAELRGIEPTDPVTAEVLDPEAFAELVIDLEEQRSPDAHEQRVDRAILAALRHVDADLDLDEIMEDAIRAGVFRGVYVPEEGTMYVRAPDGRIEGATAVTAAHEALHALQDQLVGLQDVVDEGVAGDADASLAHRAVVEGDAVIVEDLWSERHQDPGAAQPDPADEGGEAQVEGMLALMRLPGYVAERLRFPYAAGPAFVEALIDEGGFDLVDERLADPPATTAEVLRPERHFEGLEPVDVAVAGAPPGEGWLEEDTRTFGAFDVRMLLRRADRELAEEAVDAWEGGQLVAWGAAEGPPEHGEDLVVGAVLAFGDADVAAAVCAALPDWYAEVAEGHRAGEAWVSDEDALAVACDDGEITFALAPDPEGALAVAGG